jgi:hypothetical protein
MPKLPIRHPQDIALIISYAPPKLLDRNSWAEMCWPTVPCARQTAIMLVVTVV